MNVFDQRRYSTTFIITAAIAILGLILWSTILFYNRLKDDERSKMEIIAQAITAVNSEDLSDYRNLYFLVMNSNNTIPLLVLEKDSILFSVNTPFASVPEDYEDLRDYFEEIRRDNQPIEINLATSRKQYLYYGTSPVLEKLRFYPFVVVFIILLLIGVVYFFFNTTKISEQNKLWAGMAKETAHQIGTPLSSLVGWTEILKMEAVNPEYIEEINKDISRLKVITERFSKIGSIPNLERQDIVALTKDAYEYLKTRSSKLIQFHLDVPSKEIYVDVNEQLFSWTIENIVKNAIDAMRGKGELYVKLKENATQTHITISDTGKGIPKSQFQQIFEPGFTTKKRGWGLGLSLARRIIVEYHGGRIRVLHSEIGKGTTFQITLKKSVES